MSDLWLNGLCGVLWDMDGVLVDSGEFHYRAWVQALRREGIPYSRERFQATFGMDNRTSLTTLLGHAPEAAWLQRVSDEKEAAFREAIRGRARPLPGVVNWLGRLKAAGARQAVASSAPPANVDLLVDSLGLRTIFDAVVWTGDMPGKPDPAVFLEAARRIGVPPERCVVIEDAVAGVAAARRGGMKCIAVTNTNTRRALRDANVVVDSLADLTDEAFTALLNGAH